MLVIIQLLFRIRKPTNYGLIEDGSHGLLIMDLVGYDS